MKKFIRTAFVIMILFLSMNVFVPTTTVNAKTNIKLNKTKVTITVGKTKKIKLKNVKKKVTWKVTKGKKKVTVKKISGKNKNTIKLKGKKAGTATITAKVKGSKRIYKCKVTVKKKKASSNSSLINSQAGTSNLSNNTSGNENEESKPFIETVKEDGEYTIISGWTKPNARITVDTPSRCQRGNAWNTGYFTTRFKNTDQTDIVITAYSSCEPYISYFVDGRDKAENGEIINQQTIPYVYKNQEKIEEWVEEIKEEYNIDDDSSDIEKCKAVSEWLCYRLVYENNGESQGAEDVLLRGTAVCQGYTCAYMQLMNNEFHVPCRSLIYIYGNHGWNQVQIDNEWYNVDVTWMDQTASTIRPILYEYFMISAERLSKLDSGGIHNYYYIDYLKNMYPTDDTRFDDFTILFSDDIERGWELRDWWSTGEWRNYVYE